jgi:hypothetical protein
MDGGTDPERVFDGKDAVLGYLQMILDNFTQAVLVFWWIGRHLSPKMAPHRVCGGSGRLNLEADRATLSQCLRFSLPHI